jgi:23S rRNA pseudouridine1911/1915/1917 synthase
VTRFEILDANALATHLRAMPETGRTHQIRKHLLIAHHPLVGDRAYAPGRTPEPALRRAPRQMLHARRLVFHHPVHGHPIRAEARLPSDFRACLRSLKLT